MQLAKKNSVSFGWFSFPRLRNKLWFGSNTTISISFEIYLFKYFFYFMCGYQMWGYKWICFPQARNTQHLNKVIIPLGSLTVIESNILILAGTTPKWYQSRWHRQILAHNISNRKSFSWDKRSKFCILRVCWDKYVIDRCIPESIKGCQWRYLYIVSIPYGRQACFLCIHHH